MAMSLISLHDGAVQSTHPVAPVSPALPSSAGQVAAVSQLTFDSNVIDSSFKIHNSLCVLHSNAGSIFQLLKSQYPQGGIVNWRDVKAAPLDDSDVQLYQQQHPDYSLHSSNTAQIAGFKQMLDQKREKCTEGALRAYDLFNRLRDLHVGAQSLMRNDRDANSVMKELSEAELTSVCLFALSIPPTASCYTTIKSQIEQKLHKKSLSHKTDDLWSLCRELEPSMHRDTFATRIGELAYIIALDDNTDEFLRNCIAARNEKQINLDQAIDQYLFPKGKLNAPLLKHILHQVAKIADLDPDTDKALVISRRKPSFFICFALALAETGQEGKYYKKWNEILNEAIKH